MKKEEPPVVVEQTFDAPPERVWQAITQLDQMHEWYFQEIPEFKAEVGFKTSFEVVSGDRTFLHLWSVTDVAPGQRIQYDWRYQDHQGHALVTFEITPVGDQTKLTVSCDVRESFSDEIPEFRRESCIGGWEYFLQDRLKSYLDA